jgi:hypothetical protein
VTKDEFTYGLYGEPYSLRGHFLKEWQRAWDEKIKRAKGER